MNALKIITLIMLVALSAGCSTLKVASIKAPALVKSGPSTLFNPEANYYRYAIFEAESGQSNAYDIKISVLTKDVSVVCNVFWLRHKIELAPMQVVTFRNKIPRLKQDDIDITCEGYERFRRNGRTMRL